jgi:VanZ family protein
VKKPDLPLTPALRGMCLLAAVVMTVQLLFLAEPPFASRVVQVMWDKTVHFLFFGAIAFFLWVASAKRWALAVFATVLVIGAADEMHQAHTPGRNSDFNDWLADGFGAAAALIIAQRMWPDNREQTTVSRIAETNGG